MEEILNQFDALSILLISLQIFGLPILLFLVITTIPTLIALHFLLKYLRKRQIMDNPNHRSLHQIPTPRGGGIGIMIGLLPAWCIVYLFALFLMFHGVANGHDSTVILKIALIAYGLAAFSFIDDLKSLPPQLKLLVQLALVVLAVDIIPDEWFRFRLFSQFFGVTGGIVAAKIFITFIWLWFINLYNFMDGSDGITAIETISIGLAWFLYIVFQPFGDTLRDMIYGKQNLNVIPIWSSHVGYISIGNMLIYGAFLGLSLAASSLAFLKFNWHPAKIFLGDVGSIPLGFMLGFVLLIMFGLGLWPLVVILPLYYWADSGVTLVRRMLKGEKFWLPHRSHFYQRAILAGASHNGVAKHVLKTNLGLMVVGAPTAYIADPIVQIICVALAIIWVAWRMRDMVEKLPERQTKPDPTATVEKV